MPGQDLFPFYHLLSSYCVLANRFGIPSQNSVLEGLTRGSQGLRCGHREGCHPWSLQAPSSSLSL